MPDLGNGEPTIALPIQAILALLNCMFKLIWAGATCLHLGVVVLDVSIIFLASGPAESIKASIDFYRSDYRHVSSKVNELCTGEAS